MFSLVIDGWVYKGLAVVPIWDSNRRQISGMLTASDFILILMELHRNRATLTDEQLEVHTISAWKEGKSQQYGEAFRAAQLMFGRPLIWTELCPLWSCLGLLLVTGYPHQSQLMSAPQLIIQRGLMEVPLMEVAVIYKNNGRRMQKVQDPARDLSMQVLEKFSRVTRFARETTSQIFRESHSDSFGTNERRTE
ncbi:unnamed protein product [Camellia sinensis]